jgi:serine/threonine-protein kinase RsbW
MRKGKSGVFHLTLRSLPRNVAKVEAFLEKMNHTLQLDEIQIHKLMVSLTEAVNNAIVHGNKSNPDKSVTLRCEILPGWLLTRIHDQGKGFRIDKIASPLKKENLLRESGRGIFLMRTLMDKVEFEMDGSGLEVRLWLALNK